MGKEKIGNKSLRTRRDLLKAAGVLLEKGVTPTMDDVAREALVSRATAYRYFPVIEELLVEAPIDQAVPEASELFSAFNSDDLEARVDHAEATLHEHSYAREAALRIMLSESVKRAAMGSGSRRQPVRQNRRTNYIKAALAPGRDQFSRPIYERLCSALALVFGTESMIVFRDVLPRTPKQAREIKSWAVKALVRAALEESKKANRKK